MSIEANLSLKLDSIGKSINGLGDRIDEYTRQELEKYRGIKWMRLPIMQGTAAGNAVSFGEGTGQEVGPLEGYAWSVRRLIMAGLFAGTTPDVVNLYRSSNVLPGNLLWQFNGNNFGYTFGKGELTLMPGDRFQVVNVGALNAATAVVTLSGELVSIPAEMLPKLVGP